MRLVSCAKSITGRRAGNEDACCALGSLGLFAVADGMGGYEGGEIASQLAIESLVEVVSDVLGQGEPGRRTWPPAYDPALSEAENVLQTAFRVAHQRVRERRRGQLERMGSTLAALLIEDGAATIGHIGDSRIYRLRGGALEALTRDHTLAEEVARAGGLKGRGLTNVLTRAVGSDAGARRAGRPDLKVERAAPGDVFLVCSDGLSGALGDEEIAQMLAAGSVDDVCEALVAAAYEAGSHDNITAVVVGVGEG